MNFAADPMDDDARKLIRSMSCVNWISVPVACMAAGLAFFATLGDVTTIRWLTDYSGPTFLDIVRVIKAGVGTFLLWQVVFRLLPVLLFRKHLKEGTILKLDHSIVSLDLSKCEDPAARQFYLQQDRNAFLQRYAA